MAIPYSFVSRPGENRDLYTLDQPEYEFGTNTGMQGRFNPKDSSQRSMAMDRLMQLQAEYGDKLMPDYTGETGYSDIDSYAKHKNAVVEAQNIQNILSGKDPLDIEYGGMTEAPVPGKNAAVAHRKSYLRAMDSLRGY